MFFKTIVMNVQVHLILLFVGPSMCSAIVNRPVVHTKLGTVRGVEASDGDYNMYMSVPYAKVNLSNPFGAALPIEKYDDVIEADKDSLSCIHMSDTFKALVGKLDCLELNMYVPKIANETNPMPVMVFLYGGSFMTGTANRSYFGPKFLVKHDIVLVTIEHRSGPYGFFCLDIPEVPGNQGLKDQMLALQWIQFNIKAFGGDPGKVTLSSQSSGAQNAHLHYLYGPDNLFQKVILASGAAYSEKTIYKSNITPPLKISEAAGFRTNNIYKALDFLTHLDPRLLISLNYELGLQHHPCVEKKFENVSNFIYDYPTFVKRNRRQMTVMLGNTMSETKFTLKNFKNLSENIRERLVDGFIFEDTEFENNFELVESFYSETNNSIHDVEQKIVYFTSDFAYLHPNLRIVKSSVTNGAGVFMYLFAYHGQRDYVKRKMHIQANTTIHGDDLGYLFDMGLPFINQTHITKEDQQMINIYTTVWANFVKFGNPTPKKSSLIPIKWEPVTKDKMYCMVLDLDLKLIKRPFHRRISFWELFYDVNQKHKI